MTGVWPPSGHLWRAYLYSTPIAEQTLRQGTPRRPSVHRRIIALVERYRLPAIYYFRYFAMDGGLDTIDIARSSPAGGADGANRRNVD